MHRLVWNNTAVLRRVQTRWKDIYSIVFPIVHIKMQIHFCFSNAYKSYRKIFTLCSSPLSDPNGVAWPFYDACRFITSMYKSRAFTYCRIIILRYLHFPVCTKTTFARTIDLGAGNLLFILLQLGKRSRTSAYIYTSFNTWNLKWTFPSLLFYMMYRDFLIFDYCIITFFRLSD